MPADGVGGPFCVSCQVWPDCRVALALPALARSRGLIDTVEHYAVINGQWFRADRGVRLLEPVDGPVPPENGSQGWLTDEGLAASLLVQRLAGVPTPQRCMCESAERSHARAAEG
ncbi:hypothetical protein GCM10010121_096790 [Streptomyces brasiliensis]|uniref:Uncharacterized protein n=1 Tax=Streptomyces brasiliensis TaxID=1954 RepID=A0A917PCR9_9ACTN|nr:hypothetical protein GCM10010121_096790 [Streptomyces brasiliensis]